MPLNQTQCDIIEAVINPYFEDISTLNTETIQSYRQAIEYITNPTVTLSNELLEFAKVLAFPKEYFHNIESTNNQITVAEVYNYSYTHALKCFGSVFPHNRDDFNAIFSRAEFKDNTLFTSKKQFIDNVGAGDFSAQLDLTHRKFNAELIYSSYMCEDKEIPCYDLMISDPDEFFEFYYQNNFHADCSFINLEMTQQAFMHLRTSALKEAEELVAQRYAALLFPDMTPLINNSIPSLAAQTMVQLALPTTMADAEAKPEESHSITIHSEPIAAEEEIEEFDEIEEEEEVEAAPVLNQSFSIYTQPGFILLTYEPYFNAVIQESLSHTYFLQFNEKDLEILRSPQTLNLLADETLPVLYLSRETINLIYAGIFTVFQLATFSQELVDKIHFPYVVELLSSKKVTLNQVECASFTLIQNLQNVSSYQPYIDNLKNANDNDGSDPYYIFNKTEGSYFPTRLMNVFHSNILYLVYYDNQNQPYHVADSMQNILANIDALIGKEGIPHQHFFEFIAKELLISIKPFLSAAFGLFSQLHYDSPSQRAKTRLQYFLDLCGHAQEHLALFQGLESTSPLLVTNIPIHNLCIKISALNGFVAYINNCLAAENKEEISPLKRQCI